MKHQDSSVLLLAIVVVASAAPLDENPLESQLPHNPHLPDNGYEHNVGQNNFVNHANVPFGDNHGFENNGQYNPEGAQNGFNGYFENGNGGYNPHETTFIEETKKIKVPHPVLVPVEKNVPVAVPYKVPVFVENAYPVHIPKRYPVPVERPVPYPVNKYVPYPVKVPYKVPVIHNVKVPVPKPVYYPVPLKSYYPVKVPVVVEKTVPVPVRKIPNKKNEKPKLTNTYSTRITIHH